MVEANWIIANCITDDYVSKLLKEKDVVDILLQNSQSELFEVKEQTLWALVNMSHE